jgi:hypothetical protein
MDLQLVAYTPLGARLGVLPDVIEAQVTVPFGDMPTMTVKHPAAGRHADLLAGDLELGIEVWDGSAWIEPAGCRFHRIRRSTDRTDPAGILSLSCQGVGWMLRRARVWEGQNYDQDGKVQFLSANAGQILATLLQQAQGRGWGPGLSWGFTTTHDSAGQPWGKVVTIAYERSLDVWSVLANLASQGVVDWQWTGRTLQLYNADSALARDLSSGDSPVWLRDRQGVTSAPEDGTIEDLITAARVQGDGGVLWDVDNPEANPAFGRLEGYISQGGVRDEGTARLLAQAALLEGSTEREQVTREISTLGTTLDPWIDYRLGDWVRVDRDGGWDKLRVQQISITRDKAGAHGHVTLGTRLEDALTRMAKRTSGIVGGSTTDGGSGARPAPSGPDRRRPAAPEGVVVQTDAYIDGQGRAQGEIAASWAPVETDVTGVALDTVARYELWVALVGAAAWGAWVDDLQKWSDD